MPKRIRNKNNKELFYIFLRYLAILLLAVNGLFIIYWLLRPATLYLVTGILSLFGDVTIISNIEFLFSALSIELIDACIAGSAFYLLLILNLTTLMKADKRVKSLAFSVIGLFVLNVIRIVLLVLVAEASLSSFDSIHLLFWYALSIIMVAGVWVAAVRIYRIKEVPVYSDLKNLVRIIKQKKRK